MSRRAALEARVNRIYRQIAPGVQRWAYILLGDAATVAPERLALIGPRDTLYIKRIILHP